MSGKKKKHPTASKVVVANSCSSSNLVQNERSGFEVYFKGVQIFAAWLQEKGITDVNIYAHGSSCSIHYLLKYGLLSTEQEKAFKDYQPDRDIIAIKKNNDLVQLAEDAGKLDVAKESALLNFYQIPFTYENETYDCLMASNVYDDHSFFPETMRYDINQNLVKGDADCEKRRAAFIMFQEISVPSLGDINRNDAARSIAFAIKKMFFYVKNGFFIDQATLVTLSALRENRKWRSISESFKKRFNDTSKVTENIDMVVDSIIGLSKKREILLKNRLIFLEQAWRAERIHALRVMSVCDDINNNYKKLGKSEKIECPLSFDMILACSDFNEDYSSDPRRGIRNFFEKTSFLINFRELIISSFETVSKIYRDSELMLIKKEREEKEKDKDKEKEIANEKETAVFVPDEKNKLPKGNKGRPKNKQPDSNVDDALIELTSLVEAEVDVVKAAIIDEVFNVLFLDDRKKTKDSSSHVVINNASLINLVSKKGFRKKILEDEIKKFLKENEDGVKFLNILLYYMKYQVDSSSNFSYDKFYFSIMKDLEEDRSLLIIESGVKLIYLLVKNISEKQKIFHKERKKLIDILLAAHIKYSSLIIKAKYVLLFQLVEEGRQDSEEIPDKVISYVSRNMLSEEEIFDAYLISGNIMNGKGYEIFGNKNNRIVIHERFKSVITQYEKSEDKIENESKLINLITDVANSEILEKKNPAIVMCEMMKAVRDHATSYDIVEQFIPSIFRSLVHVENGDFSYRSMERWASVVCEFIVFLKMFCIFRKSHKNDEPNAVEGNDFFDISKGFNACYELMLNYTKGAILFFEEDFVLRKNNGNDKIEFSETKEGKFLYERIRYLHLLLRALYFNRYKIAFICTNILRNDHRVNDSKKPFKILSYEDGDLLVNYEETNSIIVIPFLEISNGRNPIILNRKMTSTVKEIDKDHLVKINDILFLYAAHLMSEKLNRDFDISVMLSYEMIKTYGYVNDKKSKSATKLRDMCEIFFASYQQLKNLYKIFFNEKMVYDFRVENNGKEMFLLSVAVAQYVFSLSIGNNMISCMSMVRILDEFPPFESNLKYSAVEQTLDKTCMSNDEKTIFMMLFTHCLAVSDARWDPFVRADYEKAKLMIGPFLTKGEHDKIRILLKTNNAIRAFFIRSVLIYLEENKAEKNHFDDLFPDDLLKKLTSDIFTDSDADYAALDHLFEDSAKTLFGEAVSKKIVNLWASDCIRAILTIKVEKCAKEFRDFPLDKEQALMKKMVELFQYSKNLADSHDAGSSAPVVFSGQAQKTLTLRELPESSSVSQVIVVTSPPSRAILE